MQRVKTRNDTLIRFDPISGGMKYSEGWTDFDRPDSILDLTKQLNNQPVAYLWIYPDNPVRQVWKIAINQQMVLSYDRAVLDYRIESNPAFLLEATVANYFMFLLSMISIDRERAGITPKPK